MSLFSRNCPNCNNVISLRQRLPLLKDQTITCEECHCELDKKLSISLIHSFIIGFVISWSIKHYTALPFIWALSVGMFTVFFIQPLIDLFFELEEVDGEF